MLLPEDRLIINPLQVYLRVVRFKEVMHSLSALDEGAAVVDDGKPPADSLGYRA